MGLFLFCSAGVSYILGLLFYFYYLLTHRELLYRISFYFLIFGFGLHTGSFVYRLFFFTALLFSNFFETLFFASWVMMGTYLMVSRFYRLTVVGIVLIPLSILMMYFSRVFEARVISDMLNSSWRDVHVAAAVIGQCFLGLSSVIGFLYWFQERRLKQKDIFKPTLFPPIEVLERMHYRILMIGFLTLSLGMIAGSFWATQIWPANSFLEPKQMGSFIGWCMYGGILQVRYVTGLRGRKAAWFSGVALFILIFNYVAITFLFPGHHGFVQ